MRFERLCTSNRTQEETRLLAGSARIGPQISSVQAATESEGAFNALMKTSLSAPVSGSSQSLARRFSSVVSTAVKQAPDAGRH
jgi:hypothetical protein